MVVNILSILNTTNLPVSHQSFETAQKPPYVIYRVIDTENLAADNKVVHVIENYMIELYIKKNDTESKGKIEEALNLNEIFWNRSETYLDKEKVILVAYEIQI